jgi:uncharacterized protein (DUF1330 family)
VQATLDPFDGKFIVQGGEVEAVEGSWAESVIVLSFPDMTKVRSWYQSPGKFAQQIRDLSAVGAIER